MYNGDEHYKKVGEQMAGSRNGRKVCIEVTVEETRRKGLKGQTRSPGEKT